MIKALTIAASISFRPSLRGREGLCELGATAVRGLATSCLIATYRHHLWPYIDNANKYAKSCMVKPGDEMFGWHHLACNVPTKLDAPSHPCLFKTLKIANEVLFEYSTDSANYLLVYQVTSQSTQSHSPAFCLLLLSRTCLLFLPVI